MHGLTMKPALNYLPSTTRIQFSQIRTAEFVRAQVELLQVAKLAQRRRDPACKWLECVNGVILLLFWKTSSTTRHSGKKYLTTHASRTGE